MRSRKVRRSASIAHASGWTLLLFAIPALGFGVFSLTSAILGLLLAIVGVFELKGARGLRQLDARAPKRLVMNQVLLGVVLAGYGAWGIYTTLTQSNPLNMPLMTSAEVDRMIASMQAMWTFGMVGFYGVFIGVSLLATGATAAYYNSCKRHLRGHLTTTPQWVVDVQRAAA
jgi:hypothetical protein